MDPILIPVTALMIPIIVTPTSLWLRHRLKVRQMEHNERIRAMELGVVPGGGGISWPGAAICIGIGAGVPIGTMIIAWLAMLTNDLPGEVFSVPAVVSFPAIFAAGRLAERMLRSQNGDQANGSGRAPFGGDTARNAGKSAFDPDAYDVVGSRG